MEEINEETKRKLVIPGDFLGTGRPSHGTFLENGKVYSKVIGLADEKNGVHFVIPLNGVYDPKRGDGIIGRIEDVVFSKWIVDINSPYDATLPLNEAVEEFIDFTKTDLTKYFDYGDLIFAEITSVTKTKIIQLSMKSNRCRKLRGGRIVKVTPAKVPRIIGKNGSMVEMIKDLTGTQIVVGQNGVVWIKGEKEDLATEAILLIEQRSHISGLTEQIKQMLEKTTNKSFVQKEKVQPKEQEDVDVFQNEDDEYDQN